jgi:hypothetical protein
MGDEGCRGLPIQDQECSNGPCEGEVSLSSRLSTVDFSGESTSLLTDGYDSSCFTTSYTYEPFVEIKLSQQYEVHSLKLTSKKRLPSLEIYIGEKLCKFTDVGENLILCDEFLLGDIVKIRVFGIETELNLCEIGVFGSSLAQWTNWSEWNECTNDCHFGKRTRERKCSGGYECHGEWTQADWCNRGVCEKHRNLLSPKSEIHLDSAYDFAPGNLVADGEIDCLKATAERSTCCAMSRVTTEPSLAANLEKLTEVNTVRVLLPDKISYNRLQVRLSTTKDVHKSALCAEQVAKHT